MKEKDFNHYHMCKKREGAEGMLRSQRIKDIIVNNQTRGERGNSLEGIDPIGMMTACLMH